MSAGRLSYRRCDACGAKALTAATQCPRCTTPFRLVDARGRRLEFTRCTHCGCGYPSDEAACRWCAASPVAGTAQFPWRTALALILVLGGVWGYKSYGKTNWFARAVSNDAVPANKIADRDSVLAAQSMATLPIAIAAATPDTIKLPVVSAPEAPAYDSIRNPATNTDVQPKAPITWVSMTSTTWVNVREHADKTSRIVGVIAPSTTAQLGATRGGWRQVRAVDLRGWADPHLFVR